MKRYDKYKPSGIDWIGEVPEHWEMTRLKHLCEIYGRIGYRGYTEADLVPESEGAITLSPSNFINGRLDYTKCSYLSWKKYYESPEIMIDNGDVIFVKTASVGKCALVTDLPKEATLNPQIVVFKKMKCNGAFLNYLCQTPVIQCQVITSLNGSTIATISQEKIGSYIFALPPLAEQEAIAAYLDARCADIDKVVATQEKRIALLQELKQSEITQAVTRGLNPDARMKDSGVEWIGMVPEHWEILRFKMLLREKMMYGANEAAECDDSSYPRYIRITDLTDDGKLRDETFKSLEPEKAEPYLLEKGSLLFARSGATVGKTFLFNEDIKACFAGYLIKAVFNDSAIPEYVYYYTQSKVYENWKNSIFIQATIQNIGAEKYANMPFLRPTVQEQKRIIEHLDHRCGEIDKQIGAVTKQIELLREYKQALITEVVTGKFRV